MARIRTRGQLLDRLNREAGIDVGNRYTKPQKRANLATAWAEIWMGLTAPLLGFGTKTATLATVADQGFVELPADFLDLRQVQRRGGTVGVYREPRYTSREEFNREHPAGTSGADLPGWYWIEGPIDGTTDVQRLELRPVPTTVEDILIVYTVQEPSLGDPDDDAEDATVSIDVVNEAVEAAIIGRARVLTMARDDMAALGRAQGEMQAALAKLASARGRRQAGSPNYIERYQDEGYR